MKTGAGVRVAIIVAIVGAVGAACSSGVGSSGPVTTAESTLQSTAPSRLTLTTYETAAFDFEYPAEWRVIWEYAGDVRHYQWIPVVVGTGNWVLNCHPWAASSGTVTGVACGADIFTVGQDEIVVEMYLWQGPLTTYVETPAPMAIVLPSGLSASVTETATTSLWQVYLPNQRHPLIVDARFAAGDAGRLRAQVRSLVESIVAAPLPTAK